MAHELFRLMGDVFNTPHLVLESSLHPIVEYMQTRSQAGFAVLAEANTAEKVKAEKLGSIGQINIDGVITYKPVMGMCGPQGTSYQGILEQASELIASGVDTLITVHNSPGGQAIHCFSTTNELREMCDEAGVEWVAYIDTLSASASLALGVAADEVIIHPSASTGSIGCVLALMDKSKMMANMGVKPVYIASTPGKTPFENDGSFSQEFLDDVQADVTRLGNEFAEHVAKFTGIPVKDVLSMNAKVYHAEAALEHGLVTSIMDHKTFAKYMADKQGAKNA
ncbi:MAG: S49 family peptidase [Halobacteriota archaeon]